MSALQSPAEHGGEHEFQAIRVRLEDAYAELIERCERADAASTWARRSAGEPEGACEDTLQRMADLMGEMDALESPTPEDIDRFSRQVRELASNVSQVALF